MTESIANNPCQTALEESFSALVEGWVDKCPSLLIQGASKEIGVVLDIEGVSQQHPHPHARVMIHSQEDLQALKDSGEWSVLLNILEAHEYDDIYLVDMTKVGLITEGKSVADIMEKI